MDERDSKAAHRRLSKKTRERAPPPVSYNNKYSTAGQLKRAPSAASYFERSGSYTAPNSGGLGISPAADNSHPASSLRRSPSLLTPLTESRTVNANGAYGFHDTPSASRLPSAHDLVGDSFTTIVAGAAPSSHSSKQLRPPGPTHTQTSDGQPSRFKKSPRLRQSTSFQQLARKMDTPPSATKSPRNRYSDDGDGIKSRKPDSKKKGTFSTFMSNMLGSPRRPTISTPTNPMHVTHVSIDNETGEFTVCTRSSPLCTLFAPSSPTLFHVLCRHTSAPSPAWSVCRPLLTCIRVFPRSGSACSSRMALQSRNRSSTPRRPWTWSTSTRTTLRRTATTRCGRRWALLTPTTSPPATDTDRHSPSVPHKVRDFHATSTIASKTLELHPQYLYPAAKPRLYRTRPSSMVPSSLTGLLLDPRVQHQAQRTLRPPELHLQRLPYSVLARKMTCLRLPTPLRTSQIAAMARHLHRAAAQIPQAELPRDLNLPIAARLQSHLLSNTSSSKLKPWLPPNIP